MKPLRTPAVSIVIPTLNRGEFIERCLASIQEQSFTDFEVIIQDCMSTDQTSRICQQVANEDPRFRYFREKDTGQSDALNRGLARSRGEFWTWLCSDDFYHPQALEALVHELQLQSASDPQVAGAFGRAAIVDGKLRPLGHYRQKFNTLDQSSFWHNWPLSQPSSLLWTDRVRAVGGLNPALYLGMDLDLFIRVLADNHRFAFVDKPIVSIMNHDDAKSVRFQEETALQACAIVHHHFGSVGNILRSEYLAQYSLCSYKRFFWLAHLVNRGSRMRLKYRLRDLMYRSRHLVVRWLATALYGCVTALANLHHVLLCVPGVFVLGDRLRAKVHKRGLIWLSG